MLKWIHNEWVRTDKFERMRIFVMIAVMAASAIWCYSSWASYREFKEKYGDINIEELRKELLRVEGAIDV